MCPPEAATKQDRVMLVPITDGGVKPLMSWSRPFDTIRGIASKHGPPCVAHHSVYTLDVFCEKQASTSTCWASVMFRGTSGQRMALRGVDETVVAILWRSRGEYELAALPVFSLCTLNGVAEHVYNGCVLAKDNTPEGSHIEEPPVPTEASRVQGQSRKGRRRPSSCTTRCSIVGRTNRAGSNN